MLTRALLTTLIVALLSLHCYAQCTTPNICSAPQACCADKINGELCYTPGISHDCVASTTGGFLLCPPGWLGCGNQCYLASLHQCVNDLLVPATPSTPATCPANFPCLTGESCCLDRTKGAQCYTPGVSHDCVASSAGGFLLCPPGWLGCGNQCYLASLHQCINHILVPIVNPPTPPTPPSCPSTFNCQPGELCCQDKFKGSQCYNPATFDCVSSSAGGLLLCPQDYLVCNDKLHGEQCYLPGISHDCVTSTTGGFLLCPPGWLSCGNVCYLSSQHQCVNNALVPISSTPAPPATTCPANFQCLAGESCCQDRTKGSQCYTAGVSHDCVASSAGGFLLCPPGWLGCGNQCYLATQHQCINDLLVPITPSTPNPPTTCPANFPCLAGESCCQDRTKGPQCFTAGVSHDCVASSAGGFLLCPPGWLGCGNQCYLATQHQCVNDILVPIAPVTPNPPATCPANFPCLTGESCCLDRTKGPQCFTAGVSHDCVASSAGGFLLCPPGWLGCGNQCYLASLHQCINNILIPISAPPATCPANFQCLAGESCCQDRTKGSQCYTAGVSHDCVASSAGGFLLCPPGWLGCGNACYLATQHRCVNNAVLPL